MNILIITPRIPYPPYRGDKLRMYNIASELMKNNDVTIVTFVRKVEQLQHVDTLKAKNFKVQYVKLSFLNSAFNIFKSIFKDVPFQVAWFKSKKMKNKVSELLQSGNFDIAYYHLIRSAQYLTDVKMKKSILSVIDFTDAISLYLKRFYQIEKNPIKKYLLGIEKRRVENYEKIATKFDKVLICSEVDRDYLLSRRINANIQIIRNGVDLNRFKSELVKYDTNRIIFTGNMPYYANYDAAIYFVREIFPLILSEVPNAKFYIVGQNPPIKIKLLASKNIFVTGFALDIKGEYLKSAVNVAPLRFGAGTSNKIIESLVLGVPVVATLVAVEGFPLEIKKFINIASSSRGFADHVIRFLKNPELRDEFMKIDKSVIKEILSTENIVQKLESELNEQHKKLKH